MFSCRKGMSFVTGTASPDPASRDGVLECVLGVNDVSDSLDSRPPAAVSSCSSMLNEGMAGTAVFGTGLRWRDCLRLSVLDRLDRLASSVS